MITYDKKQKSYAIPLDGRTPEALYAKALAGQGFHVAVYNNGMVAPPASGETVLLSSMSIYQLKQALPYNSAIIGRFERAITEFLYAGKSRRSGIVQAASAVGFGGLTYAVYPDASDSANEAFAKEKCAGSLAHQPAKTDLTNALKDVPADKGFTITIERTDAQARQEYGTCVAQVAKDRKELGSTFQTGVEVLAPAAIAIIAGFAIASFRRSSQQTQTGKAEFTAAITKVWNQENIVAELARRGEAISKIPAVCDPAKRSFSLE